jgi:hypothetical protein
VVDSLKALDPNRPIREADVAEQFDLGQLSNPACQPNAGPLRTAQDTLAG